LVAKRGGDATTGRRAGRPWALTLPDRVLLVAVYWRTNLTMRQLGALFGVSHSAVHRVIDILGRYSRRHRYATARKTRSRSWMAP
jgi:hypothetical protein